MKVARRRRNTAHRATIGQKGLLMENITAVMTSIGIIRLRTFVSTLDTLIQQLRSELPIYIRDMVFQNVVGGKERVFIISLGERIE